MPASATPISPAAAARSIYTSVMDAHGSHESWDRLRNAATRTMIAEGGGPDALASLLSALREHAMEAQLRNIQRRESELRTHYDPAIRETAREVVTLLSHGSPPSTGHPLTQRLRELFAKRDEAERQLERHRLLFERFQAVNL